jgi:DNA-binding LacI/PurR family transcriptional regulator
VSVTDVANHAAVSVATVSRVMNRHESVDPLLRRKVLVSSRVLGFTPKRSLQCLAIVTGRHSPAMPAGYVSVVTSLVSRFAAAKGVLVELIDVDNLDLCYEAHIDAVVGIVFDNRLAELNTVPNLPLVTINHPMADHGIHNICADHYQQGLLATRHLIQRGHRDIGFLAVEPDEWGSSERLRGYADALAEAGIERDPSRAQYSLKTPVYEILTRWKGRGVTGILNFSEDASLETLHILSNVLGLQCGKDISTISLEDIPVYQYLNPPQTTVSQPLEELARLAVETALELAGGQNKAKETVAHCLPTEIIERDSVADLTERVPQ